MAKKKRAGGKHSTPRKPVQLPEEWFWLAHKMASDRMTPTLWLIIDLIRKEAESRGEKVIPRVPWHPGGKK